MYELVQADVEVPAGLEHERFRLRMLTVDDVVKDFDALTSRVDHTGEPQPPFVPTVAQNLVDLGWHQKEFELRRSFSPVSAATPGPIGMPGSTSVWNSSSISSPCTRTAPISQICADPGRRPVVSRSTTT